MSSNVTACLKMLYNLRVGPNATWWYWYLKWFDDNNNESKDTYLIDTELFERTVWGINLNVMNAKSSFYTVTSCTVGLSHMKVADVSDKLFESCWVMFTMVYRLWLLWMYRGCVRIMWPTTPHII